MGRFPFHAPAEHPSCFHYYKRQILRINECLSMAASTSRLAADVMMLKVSRHRQQGSPDPAHKREIASIHACISLGTALAGSILARPAKTNLRDTHLITPAGGVAFLFLTTLDNLVFHQTVCAEAPHRQHDLTSVSVACRCCSTSNEEAHTSFDTSDEWTVVAEVMADDRRTIPRFELISFHHP
jgi:hypothetical protein